MLTATADAVDAVDAVEVEVEVEVEVGGVVADAVAPLHHHRFWGRRAEVRARAHRCDEGG